MPSFPRRRESRFVLRLLCVYRRVVEIIFDTCGSRTAVGVLSLACPRESTPKRRHPGRCARVRNTRGCPALLASPERETNSPADEKPTRSGSNSVSRIPSVLAAVLGLLYGDLNCNSNGTAFRYACLRRDLEFQNYLPKMFPTLHRFQRRAGVLPWKHFIDDRFNMIALDRPCHILEHFARTDRHAL